MGRPVLHLHHGLAAAALDDRHSLLGDGPIARLADVERDERRIV
jgi:hypothetical protein